MGTQLRKLDGTLLYRTELDYDTQNRLVGFGEEVNGGNTYKTTYTYDNDNRVTQIGFGGSNKVKYSYDTVGRVSKREVEGSDTAGNVASEYEFVAGDHGSGSTTTLVKKITQPKISFEYKYDSRGNITSEKRGDFSDDGENFTTTYVYDALGQLVRVNDPHEMVTWTYKYDRGGNILSKSRHYYTTGTLTAPKETIVYEYDAVTGDQATNDLSANWKDLLTRYNGQEITYDTIGNPLNDGTWTYTWQAGRQLKKMTKTGMTVEFKYDHNGLRTQKKVTEGDVVTTTNYYLHGKLLMHMTVGSDKLHFFYDDQQRPAKVNHNGTFYTYLYNLQGDVVGIVDGSGNLVVEYRYDAWGKPLSVSGSKKDTLGKLNPFRYRGYVYDEETGLYYLRSRYYNPVWGRFVNADTLLGVGTGLLSHNTYTYAYNSPVCRCDPNGNSSYFQTVKKYAYAISSADANLPFGDILVLGLLAGAAALDGLIYLANSTSNSRSNTRVKEKTRDDDDEGTYIYRKASGTYKSLTPRQNDTNGLSFSTVQPNEKYFRTTIETVNASNILQATVDIKNPTHILIPPVDLSTLQGWIDSREMADLDPHPYTILLKGMEK